MPWRPAAAVGAALVLTTAAGNGFVAAALLGVAAGAWVGSAATLAITATVARWGTADLGAVAGDQDVLGPAVTTGPALAAVSSGLAAAALVLSVAAADTRGDRRPVVVAAGIGAGALACGPAPTSTTDLLLRVGAAAAGVLTAAAVSLPAVRRGLPAWSATAVGVAAVVCAVL